MITLNLIQILTAIGAVTLFFLLAYTLINIFDFFQNKVKNVTNIYYTTKQNKADLRNLEEGLDFYKESLHKTLIKLDKKLKEHDECINELDFKIELLKDLVCGDNEK